MKKYLSILVLTVFIIPSVAFASWWNPFTWKIWNIFNRSSGVKTESPVIVLPSSPVNTSVGAIEVPKKVSPISKEDVKVIPVAQKEDMSLKITKCQSIRDIKILNIENEIDKQLVVILNDSGLLKKVQDYQSDIINLEAQRKNLLKQQLLSPAYSAEGEDNLSAYDKLALLREQGSEYEPMIQAIEREIIEKKKYLVFLNDTISKLEKDPEIINRLKNTYLEEYNKCLAED